MVVADRTRVATALVAGLMMAVYPGAVLPVLMIFAMVVGLCFELTFVGGEKIGLYLVRPEGQERFQSQLTAFEQAAMVLGPAAAGVVLSFPPPVLMSVAAGFVRSLAAWMTSGCTSLLPSTEARGRAARLCGPFRVRPAVMPRWQSGFTA